jgi:hypothetical protein
MAQSIERILWRFEENLLQMVFEGYLFAIGSALMPRRLIAAEPVFSELSHRQTQTITCQ